MCRERVGQIRGACHFALGAVTLRRTFPYRRDIKEFSRADTHTCDDFDGGWPSQNGDFRLRGVDRRRGPKKGGLSGLAIKGAFAIVKAVKPGFLVEAVDHLLDDFADRLDPFYQSQPAGRLLPSHFSEHSSAIAEALLGITDERAKRAQNQTVKKAYEKLRPTAKKHVEEAVPGIARLIEKHGAQAAA